jgi:hypothetical protein
MFIGCVVIFLWFFWVVLIVAALCDVLKTKYNAR